MKKMILGLVLFVSGFFGTIALIAAAVLSPLSPWDYNGITGFYGCVLGMQLQVPLAICIVIAVCGLALCWRESMRTK